MSRYLYPSLTIGFGLLLMVASIALPTLQASSHPRTEEQAQAYVEASRRLHSATTEDERAAALEAYEPLRRQLEEQIGGSARASLVLQMVGVGLGLVGAVWLIARQNEAEDRRAASG